MLIDETSLSRTIDAVDLRLAEHGDLTRNERDRVAAFLLDRQTPRGRGAGMVLPFPGEFEAGVHLFTGERLRTRLATRNVLTLEAARILSVVAAGRPGVASAVSRSSTAIGHACFAASHCVIGECAHSSIAYMRDAASERSGDRRKWIEKHVRVIGAHRDGSGRWKRFPFYYTLLALLEAGTQAANAEIEYAQAACRRVIGRATGGAYAKRRKIVLERAAERVGATGALLGRTRHSTQKRKEAPPDGAAPPLHRGVPRAIAAATRRSEGTGRTSTSPDRSRSD